MMKNTLQLVLVAIVLSFVCGACAQTSVIIQTRSHPIPGPDGWEIGLGAKCHEPGRAAALQQFRVWALTDRVPAESICFDPNPAPTPPEGSVQVWIFALEPNGPQHAVGVRCSAADACVPLTPDDYYGTHPRPTY